MQLDTVSRRELCCLSMWGKLKLAAERIDPSEYRDVALALVAMDVPVGQVKRLGMAILAQRGEEGQRYFMGEYADLVWDSLRDELTSAGVKAA
ncbi:MAG: hypothetical protein Q8P22_09570 [Chloroflexota bacterium]|nr:hypothetical protein [Chloroflexota bacterium]